MERGGIGAALLFVVVFVIEGLSRAAAGHAPQSGVVVPVAGPANVVRFLAVGDVNLGREAGQRILRGDTLFPFSRVVETLTDYDVVFANLECTLSEQGGETQHPGNNLIFTGPPAGAQSLRRGGVSVVSTANNHALDYGVRAHQETIRNLTEAGITFAGTAMDSADLYQPAVIGKNGIRILLFAVTDVMNIEDPMWKRYVAEADTARLLPAIRRNRDDADFIIVSYHGGEEYSMRPSRRTEEFATAVIHGGADLVLGHHPHVPHGLREYDNTFVVHSLGNFVFYQPFAFWTQRSFAFSCVIEKDEAGTRVRSFSCIPVEAGLQPAFITDEKEAAIVLDRIRALSIADVAERIVW